MTSDVFKDLKSHYALVAEELRVKAEQASVLSNATGIGTEREEVYRAFLERYLPKMCDVFLGGYLFDLNGRSSKQLDVIVTVGNTPRFRMPEGDRHIAPLEGSIAVAEIKSRLDKGALQDALGKCESIPPMPDSEGVLPPYVQQLSKDYWRDTPYKIVFAYDGINARTLCSHIAAFYDLNPEIPTARKPNLIHVLGKYMVLRKTSGMTVLNRDGQPNDNQPEVGQFVPLTISPDVSAMALMLRELQEKALLGSHLFFRYTNWHDQIMNQM